MTTTGGPPDRFRLFFVCTGNICRSPFAQFHTRFLLAARLGPAQAARFDVASAGTSAVVGRAMHPLSREQLTTRRDHPDVEAFRARQLPERDLLLADLVLGLARPHRSESLSLVPKAMGRAFTLREFARLLGAADPERLRRLPTDPVERARALVATARDTRGIPAPVPEEEDAVPDPITGGEEEQREAAEIVDAAVRVFLDLLAPPRMPPPPGPPHPPRSGP